MRLANPNSRLCDSENQVSIQSVLDKASYSFETLDRRCVNAFDTNNQKRDDVPSMSNECNFVIE